MRGKKLTVAQMRWLDDHNEPVKVWNNAAKLFGISVKNLTKVSDTGITVNMLSPYDNKYYDVGLWSNDKTVTSVQRKYTAAFDEGEAAYVDLNNDKWPYTLYFVRKNEIVGVITPYRLDFADVVKNTLPSIVNRLKEGVDNVST